MNKVLCFLIGGLVFLGIKGWSAEKPMEVPVSSVDQAPVVDGSGKDACWQEAKESGSGRWTVKAVEHHGKTFVFIQYDDIQEPKTVVRRKDDPAILKDERIEIAVMGRGRLDGTVWRMVVTPQVVYDAKQTQKFVEEWSSDTSWESDVRVKVTGRRWEVEWELPSLSRNISVWRRGPKRAEDEPLKLVLEDEDGRENRGRPWALRQESREVLEQRALEPETRERANRRVDFSEAVMKMWMDPSLTYDAFWEAWQRAGEQKLGEGFSEWRDSVSRMRQENPERAKEMFDRRREAVIKNPDYFRHEVEVERALINAPNLEAFQATVSSRTGTSLQALKVLPGDVSRPGFSMGWVGGPAGANPASSGLSKGWQDITEEQYQSLHKQRLIWHAQTSGPQSRGPAPRPGGRP